MTSVPSPLQSTMPLCGECGDVMRSRGLNMGRGTAVVVCQNWRCRFYEKELHVKLNKFEVVDEPKYRD